MNWKFLALIWIAVLPGFGNEADANSSSGTAKATIADQTSVTVMNDLAFGKLLPAVSSGTVVITPTNARSKTGNVALISSIYNAALFTLTGTAGRTYNITLPQNNSVLIHNPANDAMIVNTFSSDANGGGIHSFDANGIASFKVGGTLQVRPRQAAGVYTGTFTVGIIYN